MYRNSVIFQNTTYNIVYVCIVAALISPMYYFLSKEPKKQKKEEKRRQYNLRPRK